MLPTDANNIRDALQKGQAQFRRLLAQSSNASASRLLEAYRRVLARVERDLKDVKALASDGDIRDTGALVRLQDDLQAALNDYTKIIAEEAQRAQREGITAGLKNGEYALQFTLDNFATPSIKQMETLINYVDGSAFRSSLKQYGEYHSNLISDLVLRGVAENKNPRAIAAQIAKYCQDIPLADALKKVRTVQLWSARSSSHQLYKDNADVVMGWVWSSARDKRTCMGCWSLDGQKFPVDAVLNDHHMGRCAPIPITPTWAQLGFSDGVDMLSSIGEEAFRAMPTSDQKFAMGAARWRAWMDGAFKFEDQSTTYDDPIYGEMRRAKSLIEILGKETAAAYKAA